MLNAIKKLELKGYTVRSGFVDNNEIISVLDDHIIKLIVNITKQEVKILGDKNLKCVMTLDLETLKVLVNLIK